MSYIQEKRVELRDLISGSFSVLGLAKRELAIYFSVFLVLSLLPETSSAIGSIVTIVSLIAYFLGQYLIYQAILREAGLLQDDRKRVFGFAAMALMLGFAIHVGAGLFIIPGILLGAKWIMAPAYLVARDRNVFEAIGDSWRASEFNTGQLALAYLVFWLIWLVIFMVLAGIGTAIFSSGSVVQSPFGWLAMHSLPVMMMGLSISAYRQLSDDTGSLRQVFA